MSLCDPRGIGANEVARVQRYLRLVVEFHVFSFFSKRPRFASPNHCADRKTKRPRNLFVFFFVLRVVVIVFVRCLEKDVPCGTSTAYFLSMYLCFPREFLRCSLCSAIRHGASRALVASRGLLPALGGPEATRGRTTRASQAARHPSSRTETAPPSKRASSPHWPQCDFFIASLSAVAGSRKPPRHRTAARLIDSPSGR